MNTKSEHYDILKCMLYPAAFIALLWFIKGVEIAFNLDFGFLGIYPKHLEGSIGIITAPMVHGDLDHLTSNSVPLLILATAVLYSYRKIAWKVFILIYFLTGFWVWVSAREVHHIGASGLVYGMAAFLLFSGILRKDKISIAWALVVVLLYGGMVWGILPLDNGVSWESHLFGGLAGTLCAFYYRRVGRQMKVEPIEEDVDLYVKYHNIELPNLNTTDAEQDYRFIYRPNSDKDE